MGDPRSTAAAALLSLLAIHLVLIFGATSGAAEHILHGGGARSWRPFHLRNTDAETARPHEYMMRLYRGLEASAALRELRGGAMTLADTARSVTAQGQSSLSDFNRF